MTDNSNLFTPSVEPISIVTEMERSYLDYAMSVIVSRALPDVRDGLKPVQRRILYAQYEMGNEFNKAYKKSARIVGDVMGKYHPHGDNAIYDALARMAQDFSLRVPLQDGQGNFGSMDGDKPAAMRYTEIRMAKVSTTMLADIDKDTVDFRPNYDGNDNEPSVLPARFPNVLVNGATGIAVGMATNIPPHNLGEVIDATIHLVDHPLANGTDLLQFIQGPDFPTGGLVMGRKGINTACENGRGSVILRGKAEINTTKKEGGREAIIISEIPYMVNKARLVERIAELVRDKLITGISDLRDESDRNGVRVVVELKRDAQGDVVLSQLYKHTPLQTSISYNMLALDNGRPKLMGYKQILQSFLRHREEVITRRTKYELRKARDRAHVLVGLAIAVANIDEVIKIVRNAPDPATAKEQLIARKWAADSVESLISLLGENMQDGKVYQLSATQAQAILDLRLHRLTGLERDKINQEASDIAAVIGELVEILSNRTVLLELLKGELIDVKERFATPRRTQITDGAAEVNLADLIEEEDVVVTVSSDGYVKRVPITTFRAQRRGGKGRSLAALRDDETIDNLFISSTHDPILVFSNIGKVYTMKVYELPATSANSRGKAFVNLLPLEKGEVVQKVIPVPRNTDDWQGVTLLFGTQNGLIRRTPLTAFSNVHKNGIKGMGLNDGDSLIEVQRAPTGIADEDVHVLISTRNGQAVRFTLAELRPTASRTALGVRGVKLKDDDLAISMHVLNAESDTHVLSVTENGYGKQTEITDFPAKSRGTMGVISIKTTDRNGKVVTAMPVAAEDEVMIATSDGTVIRTKVADISIIGRNTQGVRLFKVEKGATVSLVGRLTAEMLNTGSDEDDADTADAPALDFDAAPAAEAAEAKTEESTTTQE